MYIRYARRLHANAPFFSLLRLLRSISPKDAHGQVGCKKETNWMSLYGCSCEILILNIILFSHK